ncbi:MAG: hypothetical protein LBL18_03535 [Bacteroidales bacterium]|jgi:hypothetical protein|nr:hypothetical protein [Bacteroidales bacterium]
MITFRLVPTGQSTYDLERLVYPRFKAEIVQEGNDLLFCKLDLLDDNILVKDFKDAIKDTKIFLKEQEYWTL